MKRATLALLAAATAAAPVTLDGQGRLPRRVLFTGLGVAVGLGLTAVYSAGEHNRAIGWCTSGECVGILSTTVGGLVGFMIGREADSHYALRYRSAPPLTLAGRTRALRTRATFVTLDRALLAAWGDEGAELVAALPSLEYLGRRGQGLRNVTDAAVDQDRQRLLLSTPTGLYLYGLAGEAPGTRVLGGEVAAIAPLGRRLAVATATALRLGEASGDSVVWRTDSTTAADRVTDLRWQNDTLLWVLTESALWAYRAAPDGPLAVTGRVDLRGSLRRVDLRDTVAAVAAGSEGVYLVHVGNPAAPRVMAHWSEPRFVYDVAVWANLVAAAAGPEGLYLLQQAGGDLAPMGLDRNAGFVSSVAVSGESLYALDRSGGLLRRLDLPHRSGAPDGR